MDEATERAVHETLTDERFGVLALAALGRLHTATVLFARTPAGELVYAIRPATLKAQLAAVAPTAAFHIDNRAIADTDRTRFTRIAIEGSMRLVSREDAAWGSYQRVYAEKLPFGEAILANNAVEMYVLTPRIMRVAVGGHSAEDITLSPPTESHEDSAPERAEETVVAHDQAQ